MWRQRCPCCPNGAGNPNTRTESICSGSAGPLLCIERTELSPSVQERPVGWHPPCRPVLSHNSCDRATTDKRAITRGRQTDLGRGAPGAPPLAPGSKHGRLHTTQLSRAFLMGDLALPLRTREHMAHAPAAARAGGGYDFSGASPHGSEYCSETTDHCAVSQSISRRRHLCRCRPGTTGSDILARRMPPLSHRRCPGESGRAAPLPLPARLILSGERDHGSISPSLKNRLQGSPHVLRST